MILRGKGHFLAFCSTDLYKNTHIFLNEFSASRLEWSDLAVLIVDCGKMHAQEL